MKKKTPSRQAQKPRPATSENLDPLATLLAMPLRHRIQAVAKDVRTRADTFRSIDAFELAEALEVPQPDSPVNGEWSFTTHADDQTIEEFIGAGGETSDVLGWLQSAVAASRIKTLEKAFAKLVNTTNPSFDFLTAKERKIAEDIIGEKQIEANQWNGMGCIASYCVTHGALKLWFEADVEDDGSCINLRTPYDDRDGSF